MSKEVQNTEIATQETFNLSVAQAKQASLVMLKADELLAAKSTGIQLVAKYLELKEGETIKAFYTGLTLIQIADEKTGEPADLKVAQFVAFDENKKAQIYFCGSKMLVSAVSQLAPNTPVEVSYLTEENLGKGKKLKHYSVELLEL